MEFWINHFYWVLWGFGLLILLIFYIRHQKRIRAFLLGSSTGLTALFLLHFYGGMIGYSPSLCLTNLLTCGILGVPGAAMLILAQAFG